MLPFARMPSRRKTPIAPERVLKKVAECNFFLEQMQQHEHEQDEFAYCLSAFLTALQSVAWVTPMADLKRGKQLRSEIEQLAKTHPDLKYLLNARGAEVHREGVALTMSFGSSLSPQQRGFRFPSSRFQGRYEGRFAHARFQPPWSQSIYRPIYRHTWQFQDYPLRNIVAICRDCLNILNAVVTRTFPGAALLASRS